MNNGAEKLSVAEVLSALADGEVDRRSAADLTARWRDDPELRSRWHGYQLIGDAMRSDELAGRGRDADFVNRLRVRLEREPVVLAPQRPAEIAPADAPRVPGLARRWATPAAMAAGFLMVAGAVLVTRSPISLPQQEIAIKEAPSASSVRVATAGAGSSPASLEPSQVLVTSAAPAPSARASDAAVPFAGVLLRDARMQQYFEAHQQFGGSTALGLPSAFLRNATFDTPVQAAGSR